MNTYEIRTHLIIEEVRKFYMPLMLKAKRIIGLPALNTSSPENKRNKPPFLNKAKSSGVIPILIPEIQMRKMFQEEDLLGKCKEIFEKEKKIMLSKVKKLSKQSILQHQKRKIQIEELSRKCGQKWVKVQKNDGIHKNHIERPLSPSTVEALAHLSQFEQLSET